MRNPESTGSHGGLGDQFTNWSHQLVDTLRDRTIRPLIITVRGIIIGVFGAIVGLAIIVSVLIALVRIFDTSVFHGRVWATDLLFGVIFIIAGVILMSRAKRTEEG